MVLFFCVTGLARAQDDTRPNIVILLADDLGVGDLGCYGQTRIRTPHIDALAAEGVRMQRAYASAPVCAPSRCSLLTGLHSGHCSVDHNDEPNVPLGLTDPTIAEVLAREGYRTGLVGKWGLGGETDHAQPFGVSSLPTELGFGHVFAVLDQELAQDHYPDRVFVDGAWREVPANAARARGSWDADLFVDDALAFVDRASSDARPFFLYFASTLPHRELDPPTLAHAETDWPAAERAYATMVERFDADVGRLVERLDALGGARGTIVILASDNGPVTVDGHDVAFFDSTVGLRGQKRDLYEGGLRVPLIVRWRGEINPRTLDTPIALYDLFPTLTDVIRASTPTPMDGVSFLAWLRGPRTDAIHDHMFFSAEEARGGTEDVTRFAIRQGPLVLIQRADSVLELYDLDADPRQARDLAGDLSSDRASDVQRLTALRAAESTGSVRRVFPILGVEGALVSSTPERPRAFAPVDQRGFESPSPHELPRGLTIAGPGSPEVSFGDASFTLEARVRLDHLSAETATTREARRYLALRKPERSPDELLDWGVLVQAGDLALAGDPAATGHELAFVFADPEIGGHGTWSIVARELAITDGAWHSVVFRFDAEARQATVRLDDRTQTIAFEDLGHVRSDGLYILGGHQDELGHDDGYLDGAFDAFRLSRGVVPDEWLGVVLPPDPPRTLALDLGTLALGGPEVSRTLFVVNAAPSAALAMEVDARNLALDSRARLEFVRTRTVTAGVRVPLTLRFRPDFAGVIDEHFTLVGFVAHYGIEVPEGLIDVHVVGEVVAPPPGEGLPLVPILLAIGISALAIRLAIRRRRAR